MSKKASTYFPNYQLRRGTDLVLSSREISFPYAGVYFTTKTPLFGATETQKAALNWAVYNTPPVICIKHEAPTAPDKKSIDDPNEPHRWYTPYAMAIAILECLVEETPRKIKIYFCYVEYHEHNIYSNVDSRSRGVYVVPLA